MRCFISVLIGICLSATAPGAVREAEVLETNPDAEVLRQAAEPIVCQADDYGCGPLVKTGRTFYVAVDGDDANDGLSAASAWRTIRRGLPELQAGDTLLIGEGEYIEPQLEINVSAPQTGVPGRPIRIMAAPRNRVIISGAPLLTDFQRSSKWRYLWMAQIDYPALATVWENLRNIELQRVPSAALADELPGAYWHDTSANRLYVHFSDSRDALVNQGVRFVPASTVPQQHALPDAYIEGANASENSRKVRHGLCLRGDYILVQGLWFKHHVESVAIAGNPHTDSLGGRHTTIENCVFFANENAGVLLADGAERCLMRDNVFFTGGFHGACLIRNARDNLIQRNVIHIRPPSSRARTWAGDSVLTVCGDDGSVINNHMIDNIVAGHARVEWHPISPGSIVQGNVFYGLRCSGARDRQASASMTLRNNLLGPDVVWDAVASRQAAADWAAPDVVFINNAIGLGDAAAMQSARFADPAWHDYRLQSDSPLRGAGLNGFNRGPIPRQDGNVYYVGPEGDDAADGGSERLAFRTFKHAADVLQPGDVLYVLPGSYSETLIVERGGTVAAPVNIRAHGGLGKAVLPAVEIRAPYVELAGFMIDGGRQPGVGMATSIAVLVSAPQVDLSKCLVRRATVGVYARLAPNLGLYRLTITECDQGLVLAESSTNAEVRECVIADNRLTQVEVDETSRAGCIAGQNCCFGSGLRRQMPPEFGHLTAAPVFEDPAADDFRLRWDSPTCFIAPDGQPPGAAGAALRMPQIADAQVTHVWPGAAILRWSTPFDDTVCHVEFRPAASDKWETSHAGAQGTVHGAGLSGLQPATEYVCRVVAVGRRGGECVSDLLTFSTPVADAGLVAQTYYVAPDGDDAAYGQTPDKAWRTLRKACVSAGPGDTVLVAPGVYRDTIRPLLGGTAEQRLVFRRRGAGSVIVDGEFYAAPLVFLAGCNHVVIDGFTFVHAASDDRAGLFRFDDCQGVELLNCRMTAMPPDVGVLAAINGCRDMRLEGADHLCLDGRCRDVSVRNNTFVQADACSVVIADGAEGTRLLNNIFYQSTVQPKEQLFYWLQGDAKNIFSDYNLFFAPDARRHIIARFHDRDSNQAALGRDLAEWQKLTGHDRHSLAANPLFDLMTDGNLEAKGDFSLKPGSPALGAGENGEDIGAFWPDRSAGGGSGNADL
jgi:hypothetical protein